MVVVFAWKILQYRVGLKDASRYSAELLSSAVITRKDSEAGERGSWFSQTEKIGDLQGALLEAPDTIDFAPLLEINPDVSGWLILPGTGLSEVVAKSRDNEEYLHQLIDGTQNASGTLFLDCRNDSGFTDSVSVIYGHHMKDGSKFGSLMSFRDPAYMEEHREFLLYTPEGLEKLRVIACFTARAGDDIFLLPKDEEGMQQFLSETLAHAAFDPEFTMEAEDRYVVLSTCAYDYEDERFLVVTRIETD